MLKEKDGMKVFPPNWKEMLEAFLITSDSVENHPGC